MRMESVHPLAVAGLVQNKTTTYVCICVRIMLRKNSSSILYIMQSLLVRPRASCESDRSMLYVIKLVSSVFGKTCRDHRRRYRLAPKVLRLIVQHARRTQTHACMHVWEWYDSSATATRHQKVAAQTQTLTHTRTQKNNAHRVLLVRMAFNCLKSWGAEMTTNIMNCWKPHCTDKSLVWTAKPCTPFACTMCVLFGTTKLKIHSWK